VSLQRKAKQSSVLRGSKYSNYYKDRFRVRDDGIPTTNNNSSNSNNNNNNTMVSAASSILRSAVLAATIAAIRATTATPHRRSAVVLPTTKNNDHFEGTARRRAEVAAGAGDSKPAAEERGGRRMLLKKTKKLRSTKGAGKRGKGGKFEGARTTADTPVTSAPTTEIRQPIPSAELVDLASYFSLTDATESLERTAPVSAGPTSGCRIAQLGGEDFVDVVVAMERGWILAEFSTGSDTIRCLDCRRVDVVDCPAVECHSAQSCAGSRFVTTGDDDDDDVEISRVACRGVQSCQGASFGGIDEVVCAGLESCATSLDTSVTFGVGTGSVECTGDASCLGAVFGLFGVEEVTCGGVESCLRSSAVWVESLRCTGNRSCVESDFGRGTRAVDCGGNGACERSLSEGAKKLTCGTPDSCFGVEWQ